MDFSTEDLIEIIKVIGPVIAAALSAWAVIISKNTASAVDGKMSEVILLVTKAAKAEGKEEARNEVITRQGIADAAVLAEKNRVPVVTPAVAATSLISDPDKSK